MKPKEITGIVKQELKSGVFDNWHGITETNLAKHLVEPVFEEYEEEFPKEGVRKYWTVLHERPPGTEGYTVFYSEEDQMFGLAVSGNKARFCSIGLYGTFLEALNAM